MAYKKPDGKYKAVRMIGGIRRTRTFDTKAEARKWEAEQSAELWMRQERPILTALSAATEYLKDVEARMVRKTLIEKQTVFRLLFATLAPQTPMEEITAKDAARFLNRQNESRGGNAANGDRKNLAAWWTWAQDALGVEAANPFHKVRRFGEVRTERHVPTVEDMETLLKNETGEIHTFLLTLLHTAARVGELFRLRWSDLDFEHRTVRLGTRKRKGGSLEHDKVPMTEALRVELKAHKEGARSVFVFCRADGQPYTQRIHLMERLCRRHGVQEFGFHGIRHLTASMLDAAGVELATIQAILRHKSATTTAKYLHSLRGTRVELDHVFEGEKKAPGRQTEGSKVLAIST